MLSLCVCLGGGGRVGVTALAGCFEVGMLRHQSSSNIDQQSHRVAAGEGVSDAAVLRGQVLQRCMLRNV